MCNLNGSFKLEKRATGMHTEAGSKVALPFLFISFDNHQLRDQLTIIE
jgi:hypothetical protein